MSERDVSIQLASTRDIPEVVRLYNAYRAFYGEAPDEARASTFIRDRVSALLWRSPQDNFPWPSIF